MQRNGKLNSENLYFFDICLIWDNKAHVVEVHTFPEYICLSCYLYNFKECFVLWLLIGFIVWNLGKSIPPNITIFLRKPLLTGLSLKAGFNSIHPFTKVGLFNPTWKAIRPPILKPFKYTGSPGYLAITCFRNSSLI